METHTFSPKNAPHCIYTVKVEFLKNCTNPEEKDDHELWDTYKIFEFFHNTEGPALVDKNANREEYFINAEYVKEEDRARLIFNKDFKKTFRDSLKD